MKCPICNSGEAYQGLFVIECDNINCNYYAKSNNSIKQYKYEDYFWQNVELNSSIIYWTTMFSDSDKQVSLMRNNKDNKIFAIGLYTKDNSDWLTVKTDILFDETDKPSKYSFWKFKYQLELRNDKDKNLIDDILTQMENTKW